MQAKRNLPDLRLETRLIKAQDAVFASANLNNSGVHKWQKLRNCECDGRLGSSDTHVSPPPTSAMSSSSSQLMLTPYPSSSLESTT